ncbi:Retrovirus-related Pol polyprotein from transposon TNT 1-94 [Sesamum angolense]|uniref:Retrovirus-related Pol polyprotein from transposon TNT 1-94 n=1 Tax=Sesamum angolense TaxID=2727404 RepID=A0AAE1VZR5_9LAMI|nr:Retrovirus-related Pol polyprotein from transposon TNT 1-94 [Sesamum angolense]
MRTKGTSWISRFLRHCRMGPHPNRQVRSIILASMSNDVQKQYDRLNDVASILQRMKEVYAIPDRHTRCVATKEFFSAKMTERSSVQEHGVKMLSLVKKLEDLKTGLENDTYIDVILQSLPLSYDPLIVNFNMNGLEKSVNELINMLVQYEATIKKSAPSVLIGEASTSTAKGKRAGRWKRKKGKAKAKTVVVAKDAKSAPVAPVRMGKGKKRMGMFVVKVNMVTNSASWVLDTGCGAHICNDLQVLQRSRKLSKDEVVLRLGDGKAVAAEAVGIINLVLSDRITLEFSMIKNIISIPLLDNAGFEFFINKNCFYLMKDGSSHLLGKLNNGLYILQRSDWIMTAQNKRKLENLENAHIWHAMLGHISQDRMKRLVDSKSLEIDNLDNLLACESCLKGKMTKKPFIGQSKLANGLLDLIHTDVCGPLNTQARGGFSYFITFTDDHSRLEVENQTGRKIKTLRSDRGGEYLSGEFIDYLKKNDIVSQSKPPGMPQLNGVAERRNRTLLDMIRSIMSFTELPLSFQGYALETAARLLNIAPSKTVAQTPYQIWHGKPASYKYLRVWGSPAYVKRLVGYKLDSRSSLCRFIGYPKETAGYYFYDPTEQKESSEAPQSNAGTSSAPDVSTDNVPILRRSARVPQPPERYGFLGVTVDRPKGVRPVGCKWVYKRKIGADGEVTNFKARLVAKEYTQRPGVDFEDTFLPVAMAKSIRIMLAIAAWYDYEIWQMDVKTAFLNGFVEEEIYMDQSEGFTVVAEEQKVCHPKDPSIA